VGSEAFRVMSQHTHITSVAGRLSDADNAKLQELYLEAEGVTKAEKTCLIQIQGLIRPLKSAQRGSGMAEGSGSGGSERRTRADDGGTPQPPLSPSPPTPSMGRGAHSTREESGPGSGKAKRQASGHPQHHRRRSSQDLSSGTAAPGPASGGADRAFPESRSGGKRGSGKKAESTPPPPPTTTDGSSLGKHHLRGGSEDAVEDGRRKRLRVVEETGGKGEATGAEGVALPLPSTPSITRRAASLQGTPPVGRKMKGAGQGQENIPSGRPVAAKVTNPKDKSQEWILARVRHWYADKGRYEVEDHEDDETGQRP
jgi:hypothetical protein